MAGPECELEPTWTWGQPFVACSDAQAVAERLMRSAMTKEEMHQRRAGSGVVRAVRRSQSDEEFLDCSISDRASAKRLTSKRGSRSASNGPFTIPRMAPGE